MNLSGTRTRGVLAGLAFLASSLGLAAPATLLGPGAGDRTDPGANLTATWTVGAGAIAGANELELVLSLDGGATFPVRLTGRIHPSDRLVSWRVPALPTEHARIALRAGRDEEGETESILLVSDAFSIAPAAGAAAEELFAVATELRTREALEGAPAQAPPTSFSPVGPGPALEPIGASDPGLEDAPAISATIDLAASSVEIPPVATQRESPLPATSRKAPVPLRL